MRAGSAEAWYTMRYRFDLNFNSTFYGLQFDRKGFRPLKRTVHEQTQVLMDSRTELKGE